MITPKLLAALITIAAFGCSPSQEINDDGILTNSLGMKLKLIEAGSFRMGYDGDDALQFEKPSHYVTLSRDFLIGIHQVTQKQYLEIMGDNPSRHPGENQPVENITKAQATEFCRKLSEKEGATYRLPTDAEWEYACRAGTSTPYFWGTAWEDGKPYVWYAGNSGGAPHPVGQKRPNQWGLYDMPGNVSEFVSDHFGYPWPQTRVDPTGPVKPYSKLDCTIRGVAWDTEEGQISIVMRPSFRYGAPSGDAKFPKNIGFRIVCEISPNK